MRRASYIAVLATLAAVAMALAGASSAAQPRPGHAPGVAGSKVVKQIGKRNYAGPNCPGRGWNCTRSTRVLQIATDGGENVVQCFGGVATPPGGCVIDQHGTINTAACVERSAAQDAVQSCMVTQAGARNIAVVFQGITTRKGSAQTGSQTASVTQGPAAGGTFAANDLALVQNAVQIAGGDGNDDDLGDGDDDEVAAPAGPQSQDASQSAVVTQNAMGAGGNRSLVRQSQLQRAFGGSPQLQNTGTSSGDCAPAHGPSSPNACANISQTSAAGTNMDILSQSIDEGARTAVASAVQTQGSGVGGLDGKVHQGTATGHSTNAASQKKTQKQFAPPGSTQSQSDPISCCGTASQDGGTGNSETIDQSASQSNNTDGSQDAFLSGESRSPTGSCSIHQQVSENNASSDGTRSEPPLQPTCVFLVFATSCGSSFSEGGCSETTVTTPPECFEGCLIGPLTFMRTRR